MTAKAALCLHLLKGEVLNIKNVFSMIGLTNCPREISRMVEKPFGVVVSRTKMEGKSRYGQSVTWVNYKLNRTLFNEEGVRKMVEYVKSNTETAYPKTTTEQKTANLVKSLSLF